jgi:hypothetical protein
MRRSPSVQGQESIARTLLHASSDPRIVTQGARRSRETTLAEWSPAGTCTASPTLLHEFRPPAGVFVVARLRGEPIGCGRLKLHGVEPADVKLEQVLQRRVRATRE